MVSPNPKQPVLKAALYSDEPSSFTDLQILFKQFMPKKMRPTRTSPPIANDTGELELYFDKTALRLYTKVDGTLRYVQFT
jgi:hypothetical protein